MCRIIAAMIGVMTVHSPGIGSPPSSRTKRDLELGSAITLKDKDRPLSKVIEVIKEVSGNRIKIGVSSSQELDKILEQKVALTFNNESFWTVTERLAKLTSLEFDSLEDRSLNLSKAPPRSVKFQPAGKSKIVGAFLLLPEIERSSQKLYLRLRSEPWIGAVQLLEYKATLILDGGQKVDQVGKVTSGSFDFSTWETILEIKPPSSPESRKVIKLELEVRLLAPLTWEAKTLGSVSKLAGKEERVGKTKVLLKKAIVDKDKGELQLEVLASPLWIPGRSVRLLDPAGEAIWLKSCSVTGGNGKQFLTFEYPLDKIKGDPLACQIAIQAPVETVEHVIKTTLEDIQVPRQR